MIAYPVICLIFIPIWAFASDGHIKGWAPATADEAFKANIIFFVIFTHSFYLQLGYCYQRNIMRIKGSIPFILTCASWLGARLTNVYTAITIPFLRINGVRSCNQALNR